MTDSITQVLKRYGSTIMLQRDGAEVTFRGFLQHSGSKSWQNMRSEYNPLGRLPGGQYVLIAPLTPELQTGDLLTLNGKTVVICTLETVMQGDQQLYQWGLCENAGGEDTWGSQS